MTVHPCLRTTHTHLVWCQLRTLAAPAHSPGPGLVVLVVEEAATAGLVLTPLPGVAACGACWLGARALAASAGCSLP